MTHSEQLWLWMRCRKQCESSSAKFHALLTFGRELSIDNVSTLLMFEQKVQLHERMRASQKLTVLGNKGKKELWQKRKRNQKKTI